MQLEYFKYFYDVANEKSISKVALKSHISQSALSKQIQKLEDSLGVKLMERSNKGIELTEAGKIALKYSENILKNYVRLGEVLQSYILNDNVVKIDACWSMAAYIMPAIIYEMKKKFTDYSFQITSNNCEKIEDNILQDVSDVGVVYRLPENKSIVHHKLSCDKFALVSGGDINIPENIKLNDIFNYPMIMLSGNPGIIHAVNAKLREIDRNYKDLNVVFTVDSVESIKYSLKKGQGIAILPYMAVKEEIENGILRETIVENLNMEYNIHLIYKKQPSVKIKNFVEVFRKVCKSAME
ncbi:MAG: putative Transcriptional regulator [Clostridiaceae bacterium]|jgi:DNA-binding transcriptional LysR family regulator|nr:putative Transcriptional regulator [Clostridiaceae bacterium]